MDATPKSSEPLFLFDDDADVEFVAAGNHPVGLDAIEQPQTTGTFDLEAYQRESLARHRREVNKTRKSVVISDPASPANAVGVKDAKTDEPFDDKKPRQKPMRLDEGTLLSNKGFPHLIKDTKDFRIKGKGHEATDLHRLFQIYQFWAHQLHPKTQFRDTVQRVEKLCHSRRMLSALSVWRDEAHGKLDEDSEVPNGQDHDMADQDQEPTPLVPHDSPSSSRPASHPPTSDMESEPNLVVDDFSDTEMDALIQEYANGQDSAALEGFFAVSVPQPDPNINVVAQSDLTMADVTTAPEEEEDWGEDMYI